MASSKQALRVALHGVLVAAAARLTEAADDALPELLWTLVRVGLRDVGLVARGQAAVRLAAFVRLATVVVAEDLPRQLELVLRLALLLQPAVRVARAERRRGLAFRLLG